MAESDIYIVPQDQTVSENLVVVNDAQRAAGYQFDAVKRYRTKRTYRVTKHAVPSGLPINDHVTRDPVKFQLAGVITPYNVFTPEVATIIAGVSQGSANSSFDALGAVAETALEKARKNRDQLVQYADEFTLLTVMGDEFAHANMIITSIDDPKTPKMGDSYELTVSFEQVKIPQNAARIAPIIDEDADLLGGGDVKDVTG
jgi:hypothetical protein